MNQECPCERKHSPGCPIYEAMREDRACVGCRRINGHEPTCLYGPAGDEIEQAVLELRKLSKYGTCNQGHRWRQVGNQTGHCSQCHRTFSSLKAFDRHQRLNESGPPWVTCLDPAQVTTSTGKPVFEARDGGGGSNPSTVWAIRSAPGAAERFAALKAGQ